MYLELKTMEMERRRRVALEAIEKEKVMEERMRLEALKRERVVEERMRLKALEKQKVMEERMKLEKIKQDQLKKERLQWKVAVEEELKRYTFRALDEEHEEVELYCLPTEGDKANPKCLTSHLKPAGMKKKTLSNNWVGENILESSVYPLFAAKPHSKSEGLYHIPFIPLHFSFLFECKLLSSFV